VLYWVICRFTHFPRHFNTHAHMLHSATSEKTLSTRFFLRLLLLSLVCLSGSLNYWALAQNQPCPNDALHTHWLATNPGYAAKFTQQNEIIAAGIQKLWENRTSGEINKSGTGAKVYTIPVVVHIMHHPDSVIGKGTNPADAAIITAINHLNESFKNAAIYDPTSGEDIDIEFCLATTNPWGNATNGITRYGSLAFTYLDFPVNDSIMKFVTGWDRTRYFNIWTTYSIADVQSNIYNYAGYAPPAPWHGTNRDGVVVRQDFMGTSFDNSKVLIHEVGHYLNLFHTFYGGCTNFDCRFNGDYVCDTPPDALSNGSFCNPINSCTTDANDVNSRNPFRPVGLGGLGDQNDQIENYMDYGNRFCQTVFTLGQKDRMRISLTAIRGSLLESNGCRTNYAKDVGITAIVLPGNFSCNGQATVTLKNFGSTLVNSARINYSVNGNLYLYTWTGTLQPGKEVNVLIDAGLTLANGAYTFTAYTTLPDMAADQNPFNDSISRTFYRVGENSLPFTENFESAANINSRWLIVNPDNSATWQQTAVSGCTANATKAMRIDNRTYTALGQPDYLYTALNLFNYATANLTFDVSYAMFSGNPSDQLRVVASTDCGKTFTTLFSRQGQELATSPPVTTPWQPAACGFWQTHSINLSEFSGQSIIIGFVNKCLNGNRIYIDNVNITGTEDVLCFPPAGLSAGNISYTSATLNWTATQPGATFNIKYRPVGTEAWSNQYFYQTGTSLNISQLSVGTTYEVFLQNACSNGYNSNNISTTFTTTYTSCPPPIELTVANIEKYSATINWEPSDNASAYLVYYAPVSSPAAETMLVTYTNSIEISGLNLNVAYTAKVKTVCSGGTTSPIFSPSINFTTAASCMPPNGVVVSEATANCAQVIWEQEDDALSYRVEHRPYGSSTWGSGTFVSSLFYNIPALTPASLYEVRVRSTCIGGVNSNYSYTVLMQTAPVCAIPAGLTVIGETETSATLVWNQQAQADKYNVRYRLLGSSTWVNMVSSVSYLQITGLNPCTNYEFQVQSSCGILSSVCTDDSDYSSLYGFSTFCAGYCPSSGSNANNLWIEEVNIDAFTYTSGNNGGYSSYNLQPIILAQDLKIPIQLTEGTPRKLANTYWKIWIDLNQNYEFDPTELVFSALNPANSSIFSTNPLKVSGFIKIPDTTLTGITRMRIALSNSDNVLPCEVFDVGEVEDFAAEITPGGGKSDGAVPQLLLYPNPATNNVFINLQMPDATQPVQICLYNLLGELALPPITLVEPNFMLNTQSLPPGLYRCVLMQNNLPVVVQKLAIVH